MEQALVALGAALFAALWWAFHIISKVPVEELEDTAPDSSEEPQNGPVSDVPAEPVPSTSTVPSTVPESEPEPDWNDPRQAWHLTRVICDDVGLTYAQKNVLCACIYQESRFMNRHTDGRPMINENRKDGKVWSTDWGICQVNDYWNIGHGKPFPSVDYVMEHPAEVVEWMAQIMKSTGKLQPWSSYTSGAYEQWLSTRSPMWALAG